jgi:3D (Asp-Asp-Asp) domain-containing protein
MNEARTEKQNLWRKSLKMIAGAYLVISSTTFLTYAYGAETQYNKMLSITEETKQTLNETQVKVEDQNKVINDLQIQNTETQKLLDETTGKLQSVTQEAEAQKARAEQAEADLKKKRASRKDSSAVPVSASTKGMMTFSSTAYCYGTTTASGTRVQQGRTIAVDPRVIPLGTQVKVVSPSHPELNGVYTAEDTGGKIKGNIIDIYVASYDKAIDYGRREVYVEILN